MRLPAVLKTQAKACATSRFSRRIPSSREDGLDRVRLRVLRGLGKRPLPSGKGPEFRRIADGVLGSRRSHSEGIVSQPTKHHRADGISSRSPKRSDRPPDLFADRCAPGDHPFLPPRDCRPRLAEGKIENVAIGIVRDFDLIDVPYGRAHTGLQSGLGEPK